MNQQEENPETIQRQPTFSHNATVTLIFTIIFYTTQLFFTKNLKNRRKNRPRSLSPRRPPSLLAGRASSPSDEFKSSSLIFQCHRHGFLSFVAESRLSLPLCLAHNSRESRRISPTPLLTQHKKIPENLGRGAKLLFRGLIATWPIAAYIYTYTSACIYGICFAPCPRTYTLWALLPFSPDAIAAQFTPPPSRFLPREYEKFIGS